MATLRDCLKKLGVQISPAEADALYAASKQYIVDGHDAVTGELSAVKQAMDDVNGKIFSIYDQAGVKRTFPKPPKGTVAPAQFLGLQEGASGTVPLEIFNLTKSILGKPEGDTVTRETLEQAGYTVPKTGGDPQISKMAQKNPNMTVPVDDNMIDMMGEKMYSETISRTTGKELWQNSVDAVMKNPSGKPKEIYYAPAIETTEEAGAVDRPLAQDAGDAGAGKVERSHELALEKRNQAKNTKTGKALKADLDLKKTEQDRVYGEEFQKALDKLTSHLKGDPKLQEVLNDSMMKSVAASVAWDSVAYGKASMLATKAHVAYEDFLDAEYNKYAPLPVPLDAQIKPPTTEAFKEFSKNSKVKHNGKMLLAFHGTQSDIEVFRTTRDPLELGNQNHSGALGSWFTTASPTSGDYDVGNAEFVASEMAGTKNGAAVMPVWLNVENPMEFYGYEEMMDYRDSLVPNWRKLPEAGWFEFRKMVENEGHDGIHIIESMTDGDVARDDWVIFSPEQAKSATGNSGAYNPKDPDITGSVQSDVLTSVGGSAISSAVGWFTADPKRDDETDEAYAQRRLLRSIAFGFGGGVMGYSAAKVFTRPASARAKSLAMIKSESVGIGGMPEWYLTLRQKPKMVALRTGIIDGRTRLKDLIANASVSGILITDDINAWAMGKTFGGRASEAYRVIEKNVAAVQEVVIESAKAAKIDPKIFVARLNAWLEAGHSFAYNDWLEKKWLDDGKALPAPTGRLTNQDATDILDQAHKDGLQNVFTDLYKLYHGQVDLIRDIMVNGGLITPDTRKVWETTFPRWVPFNRVMPDDDVDNFLSGLISGGPGLSNLSSGVRHYGKDGTDLPIQDIGGSLMANWKGSVTRVMKNELQFSAANFFRTMETNGTPIPGVTVRRPKNIGGQPEQFDPRHMVSYLKDGKPTWMIFDDANLAMAVSSVNNEQLGPLLRAIGTPVRLMSRAFTQYNLDWLVPNVLRDKTSAGWKAMTQGDWQAGIGHLSPKSMTSDFRTTLAWMSDEASPEAAPFKEMLEAGGLSGGWATSTREKSQKLIQDMRNAETNPLSWTAQHTKRLFELMSELSEGSTRLRAYESARSRGATPQEAAVASLNSSVDFNQKGTWTQQFGALYNFFNPALQGGLNAQKNLLRNPHAAVLVSSALVSVGVGIGLWNSSMMPNWKEVPQLANARNNGFPVIYSHDPATGDYQYINIPMSQELRPLKASLDFIYDLGNGDLKGKEMITEAAGRTFQTVASGSSPLPLAGGTYKVLLPAVLKPGIEADANRNYFGGTIMPDYIHTDPLLKDSGKYSPRSLSTQSGRAAIAATDFLSKHFGLEVSPDRMKYIMGTYAGGPGKLVTSTINASSLKMSELGASDVPALGGIFKKGNTMGMPTGLDRTAKTWAMNAHTAQVKMIATQRNVFNENLAKLPPTKWRETLQRLAKEGKLPQDPAGLKRFIGWMVDTAIDKGQLETYIGAIPNGKPRADFFKFIVEDHFAGKPKEQRQFMKTQREKGTLSDETLNELVKVMPALPK